MILEPKMTPQLRTEGSDDIKVIRGTGLNICEAV
jgi:hypothetical protein